jgi:hypothetical protein
MIKKSRALTGWNFKKVSENASKVCVPITTETANKLQAELHNIRGL